jgi:hypothetical protein
MNRLRRGDKFRGFGEECFFWSLLSASHFSTLKDLAKKSFRHLCRRKKEHISVWLRSLQSLWVHVVSSGMHGAPKDAKIVLENRRGTESEDIYENVISPAQLYHNKTTILRYSTCRTCTCPIYYSRSNVDIA